MSIEGKKPVTDIRKYAKTRNVAESVYTPTKGAEGTVCGYVSTDEIKARIEAKERGVSVIVDDRARRIIELNISRENYHPDMGNADTERHFNYFKGRSIEETIKDINYLVHYPQFFNNKKYYYMNALCYIDNPEKY